MTATFEETRAAVRDLCRFIDKCFPCCGRKLVCGALDHLGYVPRPRLSDLSLTDLQILDAMLTNIAQGLPIATGFDQDAEVPNARH